MTEQQQLLVDIIEEVYFDGVDAIGEPVEENGVITVEFQDGVKLLEAKIFLEKEENDIEIRLVSGGGE